MTTAIPLGSAVYVRYKDHLLYKNIPTPVEDAAERETIGWLTKQNNELILIEHDRTYPYEKLPTGSGSGLIILKSCILEIHKIPLQNIPSGSINRSKTKEDNAEYAPHTTKRKTQPK